MRSQEKHIDFDLSTGEDQDLNFNVTSRLTTGGAQDEAKLLSKKYAGAPSQKKKIERSWSDRENLLRSLSRQQQMPETINSSWADFSRYIPTFSFEVARIFLSKNLPMSSAARQTKRVQSSVACDKPVPVRSCKIQ